MASQIAKAQAKLKTPSLRMELGTDSDLTIPHEGFENSLHTAKRAPRATWARWRSHVPWWLKGMLGWRAPQAWEDLHFSRWVRQSQHTCVKGTHPKLQSSRHRRGRGPGRDS